MDLQWIAAAAIGGLGVSLAVLHQIKQLLSRVEAIEADRMWFDKKRDEHVESLEAEIYEVRILLKDLVDFHKGDGRYRHDPDDPRLPAHIRDRTGRED
jgi:hypothetical protein